MKEKTLKSIAILTSLIGLLVLFVINQFSIPPTFNPIIEEDIISVKGRVVYSQNSRIRIETQNTVEFIIPNDIDIKIGDEIEAIGKKTDRNSQFFSDEIRIIRRQKIYKQPSPEQEN